MGRFSWRGINLDKSLERGFIHYADADKWMRDQRANVEMWQKDAHTGAEVLLFRTNSKNFRNKR